MPSIDWFNPDWIWAQISIVLIAAIVGGVVHFIAKSFKGIMASINEFKEKQEIQSEAIRNIIKTMIVDKHEEAEDKGFISNYKLECSERMFDSYGKLNGNSYVEDLVEDLGSLPHTKK